MTPSGQLDGLGAARSLVSRGADDGPARVLRIDPDHGATGVLRDTLVVVRLSHPADPRSLSGASPLRVLDDCGPVPGELLLDPGHTVLMWRGERLLRPDVDHRAVVDGLEDRRGREFASCSSCFVPCGLSAADLVGG